MNPYQVWWVFVLFDLPTKTKLDVRIYTQFRKYLLKDGFQQFQYSIYIRHCVSRVNAELRVHKVKKQLPRLGHVIIMCITDKQFGLMKIYYGNNLQNKPPIIQQLELF